MTDDIHSVPTALLDPPPSRRQLRDQIDRLPVSADAKALLFDLADVTVDAGGKILAAGRRILAFTFDLARRFPNTAFGLIIGTVVSSLIATVPLVGAILAPLLTPLLLALGLGLGALEDMKGAAIRSRVEMLERHLNAALAR